MEAAVTLLIWLLVVPAIAVAGIVALAIYVLFLERYAHRCVGCGHSWQHGFWASGGEAVPRSVKAHTCARCGEVQWTIASGLLAPRSILSSVASS